MVVSHTWKAPLYLALESENHASPCFRGAGQGSAALGPGREGPLPCGPASEGPACHKHRDNQLLKEHDTSVTQDPVLPPNPTPIQAPARHFALVSQGANTEQIRMLTPEKDSSSELGRLLEKRKVN